MDLDNVLVPGSVAKLKTRLLDNSADAAAFDEIHYFQSSTSAVTHKWTFPEVITFFHALNQRDAQPCSSGNYLFTRESWLRAGRYDESIGGAYDSHAFGLRQPAAGCRFVPLTGSHYFHRDGRELAFMRDQHRVDRSLLMLPVLIPYLDRFHPADVDYLF